MIIEFLFLNKKHTDTPTEQTKLKPQEAHEFKLIKQMGYFLFNPPLNLFEMGNGYQQ